MVASWTNKEILFENLVPTLPEKDLSNEDINCLRMTQQGGFSPNIDVDVTAGDSGAPNGVCRRVDDVSGFYA